MSDGDFSAAEIARRYTGPLATPMQIRAEQQAHAALADPRIRALRPRLEQIARSRPAAALRDGDAQIGRTIDLYSVALAMRVWSADYTCPCIIWRVDNTPHAWFGHVHPAMGTAGDNPDHLYRGCFLDGEATYRLSGRLPPPERRSIQVSFEIFRGGPGRSPIAAQTAATPDMGNQVAFLDAANIDSDPDGSFDLVIGPAAPPGTRNFMKTVPGPMTLAFRDVQSDWAQEPTAGEITRIDGVPPGPERGHDQFVEQMLEELPGYVETWSDFNTRWLGGLTENAIVGPAPRDGGWGYLAAGRFNLDDDEALVVTITDGGAPYIGMQVTNHWMMMPRDTCGGTLSLNTAQVARNGDGSVTYVLAVKDPGVANWIDTGGLHGGAFLVRWQAVPPGADASRLLRSFAQVKLGEVDALVDPAVPRLDADARRRQIAQRRRDYYLRLGKPL